MIFIVKVDIVIIVRFVGLEGVSTEHSWCTIAVVSIHGRGRQKQRLA